MPSGTIERKCMKGHKKAEGRCSPRCVRWYPRIQRVPPTTTADGGSTCGCQKLGRRCWAGSSPEDHRAVMIGA